MTGFEYLTVFMIPMGVVEFAAEGFGRLLVFPIAAIFGFIPVFMYGAWLGAQLRGEGYVV
jgi:hypothetical protein